MEPTITTLLAAASKAVQGHADALAAHQADHGQHVAQRASQPPAIALPAPGPATP